MNRQLTVTPINNQSNAFSLTPRTLDEAMQYAKIISDSDFCPKESKGKPGNVLIAVQYGAELGLSPMQALQNISVINGRPCLWGDALLGLAKAHPSFIGIHEEIINDVAHCRVERKNSEPTDRTFGIEDAKKANLWGKAGPWTQYPKRMLQMRARSFALRDAFADVLKGLNMREEVEDYHTTHKKNIKAKVIDTPVNEPDVIFNADIDLKADLERIQSCPNLDELREVFQVTTDYWQKRKDIEKIKLLIEAKDKRKDELTVKEWNEGINKDTGEVNE